jgi:predicted AlkP superfamily pyrophosphatase or phosphodiesterase
MTAAARVLSLLFICLLLLVPQRASGRAQTPAPAAKYLVLVVMDGFRPDYMTLAPMHHLHALMRTGTTYTRGWVGQLETQTPTGHATLATGTFPREHHVVGFVWRNATGDNIIWTPSDYKQVSAGVMESLIESGGVPTISDLLHSTYPGSRSVSLSGEKFYAADAMGAGADYVLWGKGIGKNQDRIQTTAIPGHLPPRSSHLASFVMKMGDDEPSSENLFAGRLAVRAAALRPRMLLINLPGTDIEGHADGGVTDTADMRPVVKSADAAIGQVMKAYKKMGIFKQTLFIVTADHGMIPNRHQARRDLVHQVVNASKILYLKQDLLSTAAYIYLRDPGQAKQMADDLLARHIPGMEGVFYKVGTTDGYEFRPEPATAAALGPELTQAYLDLSNTVAVTNGPEVIMPYAEDTVGINVKGMGPHWGTHGGLSWRVQHIPMVLSGPGIRHRVSSFPAQLVDVAPTIEHLMGLPIPKRVDGVVLSDALTHASAAERTPQTAATDQRVEDVTALRARSEAQHAMVLGTGQ